jgi:hypothetical protein
MRARHTDLGWRLTNVTVHPIWSTGTAICCAAPPTGSHCR